MADPDQPGDRPTTVVAAGAVTVRRRAGVAEVLLVHRPRYDDWSFPKGKLDPGEGEHIAAVREVEEETGLRIRLGPALPPQVYAVGNGTARPKLVHYWGGRVVGDDDVSGYRPNDEIDQVAWVPLDKAESLLDYPRDRELLVAARPFERRSVPLLVLRHALASRRESWDDDDRRRPLTSAGRRQAELLVPLLTAYGVSRVATSSSERCVATVTPYALASGGELEVTDVLSEEDATPQAVIEEMDDLLEGDGPTVVCGHRPVLPMMFECLGLEPTPLDPGAMAVLHHRAGRVVAVDRVPAPTPTS
jgi:8-oxo-dGTP pyrophosphatase MutT (NUDIX family)/phosphohistidine phosphatase SixA